MSLLKDAFDLLIVPQGDVSPARHVGLDALDSVNVVAQMLAVVPLVLAAVAISARRYDVPKPVLTEFGPIDWNAVIHLFGCAVLAVSATTEMSLGLLPIALAERLPAESAQDEAHEGVLSISDLDAAVSAIAVARQGSGPGFAARS